jgi:hypothetical protein
MDIQEISGGAITKTQAIIALVVILVLVVLLYLYKTKAAENMEMPTLDSLKKKLPSWLGGSEQLDGCPCRGPTCKCAIKKRATENVAAKPVKKHQNPPVMMEYLSAPEDNISDDAEVLNELGYEGSLPWSEILSATELDPTIQDNHNQFVADVRRFSSGANFTSVNDDNTNSDFTNFIGLNRPQHVPIGADARQQPDIDQTVLQRNKYIRF